MLSSAHLLLPNFVQKYKTMKAAVVFEKGSIPQYTDFPEPEISSKNEVMVTVKAASIKNLDKARAGGKHYSTEKEPISPQL
jgi:NADPH:quinone reductase-like Zn-dependent oxidoreductase